MLPPKYQDAIKARETIAPHLSRTPLISYTGLNKHLGAKVYVKREDTQPISSFKIRGGVNFMANLPVEERARGVISPSTGNHGQGVAYAAQLFGVKCIIAVPEGANPLKVESIRNLGADVHFHGATYDDSKEYAERLATKQGLRYVHASNESLIIAGYATLAMEMLEEVPDLDVIFSPLGGGAIAAGTCLATKAIRPQTKVIAIQSAQAPAGYLSWKEQRLLGAPMRSMAEGIATGNGYAMPQEMLRESLDDFILVEDTELKGAILVYLERCHVLAEAAGAAALAGAIKLKDTLKDRKVGVILSGANITVPQLQEVLALAGT
jgi:threonine dehydratase